MRAQVHGRRFAVSLRCCRWHCWRRLVAALFERTTGAPCRADVKAIVFLQRTPRDGPGQRLRLHRATGGRPAREARAAVGGRQADHAVPDAERLRGPAGRRGLRRQGRHHVVRPQLRRRPDRVLGASFGDGKYQLYSIERRRHQPQAAHRRRQRLRLSDLPAGREDHVHDQPERRTGAPTRASKSPQFPTSTSARRPRRSATINLDGSGHDAGRAQRLAPRLAGAAADGHVVYTEWRHMGGVNDGHLRMMNTDMTGMREAFGGEHGGNAAPTATSRPATSRRR